MEIVDGLQTAGIFLCGCSIDSAASELSAAWVWLHDDFDRSAGRLVSLAQSDGDATSDRIAVFLPELIGDSPLCNVKFKLAAAALTAV